MPLLYGFLEDFHEQGMEGNSLPMFHDASKMSLNRFGTVEGGYDTLVNLEDGMYLTVYTEKKIYNWSWDRLEEKELSAPRFFDGELDLRQHYKEVHFPAKPESKWQVRIIHDAQFNPEEQHLWVKKAGIAYKPDRTREISWYPEHPCHNVRVIHYQEDNPVATFYSDLDKYKEEVLLVPYSWSTSENTKEFIENHYDWERDFQLLPAHNTWTWMFLSGFCARLEY